MSVEQVFFLVLERPNHAFFQVLASFPNKHNQSGPILAQNCSNVNNNLITFSSNFFNVGPKSMNNMKN